MVSLIKTQLHLLDLFFVISWLLWNQRNKIRVGDSVPPMDSIILEAKFFWLCTRKTVEKEWKASIEVVVRNHKGEVMVSLSEKYKNPTVVL